MSELKARIQKSTTEAMKAKEPFRVQVLRMAFSAIRKKEIDDRKDLTDAEVEKTILTMCKQLQETLEQAKSVNAAEAVADAEKELVILKEFLPQQLSEAEVDTITKKVIDALKASGTMPAGNAGMGACMKAVMAEVGSRAEGRVVQAAVKKALA